MEVYKEFDLLKNKLEETKMILAFNYGKEVFRQARVLKFDEIQSEISKWKKFSNVDGESYSCFEK